MISDDVGVINREKLRRQRGKVAMVVVAKKGRNVFERDYGCCLVGKSIVLLRGVAAVWAVRKDNEGSPNKGRVERVLTGGCKEGKGGWRWHDGRRCPFRRHLDGKECQFRMQSVVRFFASLFQRAEGNKVRAMSKILHP